MAFQYQYVDGGDESAVKKVDVSTLDYNQMTMAIHALV